MEHEKLSALIDALEKGTKVHISIVFLNHYGNDMTARPLTYSIHNTAVCNAAKSAPGGLDSCIRCRNIVLEKCIRYQKSFGGLCAKGVYEYCRPVIKDGIVVSVIFVGNILMDNVHQRLKLRQHVKTSLLKTMEQDFTVEECIRIANLIETYILFLLDLYGDTREKPFNSLIENIKTYIEENLLQEISMDNLASFFGYNKKYLGRLFKEKTGVSISEYCNNRRVSIAKKLLSNSSLHIADIAGQCGFNNVTYFNRAFKKITGLSPKGYRSRNK